MSEPTGLSTTLGDLVTLVYDYALPGVMLPMHNHDEDTSHIIIVAKGGVVILIQNPDGQIVSQYHEAGALIDTFAGFPHGIVGVLPNSRTIHIRKKLVPANSQEGSPQ